MALPIYATWLASLKGPEGDQGPQGRPGTFDEASAVSVPSTEPAEAIITGEFGEIVEFKIPQGAPGVNAVPADEAVGTYVATPGSNSRSAVAAVVDSEGAAAMADTDSDLSQSAQGLFPVYRVESGGSYPPPVDGAMNIFFGEDNPGLGMGENDYYAVPDVTTNADVAAKVLDTSSPLHAAVRTATTTERRQINFQSTGATYGSVSISGVSITGWLLPDSTDTSLHFSAPVPYGWNTALVRIYVASSLAGDVRFGRVAQTYRRAVAIPTAVAETFHTATFTANRTISVPLTGAIDLTAREAVSGTIRRYGNSTADTYAGTVLVVHAELERVS